MPAFGGSLFDPDRFPFLEGREKGTSWKLDVAKPLPIDNRTVLLLLDAVQLFEGRTLSYRALDIEQIGYVYEGLLERTVVRANEIILALNATKSSKNPRVSLNELEEYAAKKENDVRKLLRNRMGRSLSFVKRALTKNIDNIAADRLMTVCHGNHGLWERIKPYVNLLRTDRWGYPLVYPEGSFMVISSVNRRETGTHYTPKSLTEVIIKETLEPLVYVGPAEGKSREEWTLKPPIELLNLKICDPAMGSGAFLVQACRWLSDRLVESWLEAKTAGHEITFKGEIVEKLDGCELLPNDTEERTLIARRLVAEKCLYGVDINPLAVELAKLAIWLVTLAKDRPFGFLDHNLRSGDSLLGIRKEDELIYLNMGTSTASAEKLFASKIKSAIKCSLLLRSKLRKRPIVDILDVEYMNSLNTQSRRKLEIPRLIADAFVGEILVGCDLHEINDLSIEAGKAINDPDQFISPLKRRTWKTLGDRVHDGIVQKHPFHWPLEFPEVFHRENPGFDAFVGNPPFLGGKRISTVLGLTYNNYLAELHKGASKNVDLVAHFFRRSFDLLRTNGQFGLLATNTISEGDTRQGGLEWMLHQGITIHAAYSDEPWPGTAAVVTSRVHIRKGKWNAQRILNGNSVQHISAFLSEYENWTLKRLKVNKSLGYIGSFLAGKGFILTEDDAMRMLEADARNSNVLFPYLNGKDLNTDPEQRPSRWVINFWDWPEERAKLYPLPYQWLQNHVYPDRVQKSHMKSYRKILSKWWLHWNARPALYHAIDRGYRFENHPKGWSQTRKPRKKVLVVTRTSKTLAFSFVSSEFVFSDATVVFSLNGNDDFAILQSSVHGGFAWQHASRLKNDLRYSPTDALETFPFPPKSKFRTTPELCTAGAHFHNARSEFMNTHRIGLTQLYNRFHSEDYTTPQISELRDLFCEIDRKVVKAYGWDDLNLEHGFHKVNYLPKNNQVRFTISENVRIRILSRLAELNRERYQKEMKLGRRNTQRRRNNLQGESLLKNS